MAEKTEKGPNMALVVKLVSESRELIEKQTALLQEIDDLLAGKAGIAAVMAQAADAFDRLWGERYAGGLTGRYVWNHKTEKPHLKRLLKLLGLEELTARMGRYIIHNDPWYTSRRHAFQVFVSHVNQFAVVGPVDFALQADGFDCKHIPRCKSDAEHTRRRAAELRA